MSLGPLLRKELVAIARRRRTFWLRSGTLVLLSLLLIPLLIQLVVQSKRTFSVQGMAEILFQVFVWCQFGVLVMVAPAFSAGSISQERRLGTIDLLTLASIRAPSITAAKFIGASALPALLVLSEVPFLFIWTLYGGISTESILATLVLSSAIVMLLIAIGLLASALTETSGIAMVLSYLAALAYLLVPWWGRAVFPIGFETWTVHGALWKQLNQPGIVSFPWWRAAFATFAASGVVALGASVFLIRSPSIVRLLDCVPERGRVRSRNVVGPPVLWREVVCGGGRRVTTFLNFTTLLSVLCLAGAVLAPDAQWTAILGGVTVAVPPIAGGVLSAISVTLEKEGRSISALLLMPSAATSVVFGKFLGVCARALPLTLVPVLLGIARAENLWLWSALSSATFTTLLIASGVLFSVLFAKSAVSVAVTFAGTIFYTFCCCYNVALFPIMLMSQLNPGTSGQILAGAVGFTAFVVLISTVLAISVGMFETRAREAV